MKRILLVLCLLLLAVVLFSSCAGKKTAVSTQNGESTSPDTTQSAPNTTTSLVPSSTPDTTDTVPDSNSPAYPDQLPAEGVLSCIIAENTVAISITLADCADEEVSLLILTDPMYRYTWSENAENALLNLGQVTLDTQGKGSLSLPIRKNTNSVFVLLTASSGCYIAEVK